MPLSHFIINKATEESVEYASSNITLLAGNASEILFNLNKGIRSVPVIGKFVKVGCRGARTWSSYCKGGYVNPSFYLNAGSTVLAAGSLICETAHTCTGIAFFYGASVGLGAASDLLERSSPLKRLFT